MLFDIEANNHFRVKRSARNTHFLLGEFMRGPFLIYDRTNMNLPQQESDSWKESVKVSVTNTTLWVKSPNSLNFLPYLQNVSMANGSQTQSKGVGNIITCLTVSLSIWSRLPLNLLCISCLTVNILHCIFYFLYKGSIR